MGSRVRKWCLSVLVLALLLGTLAIAFRLAPREVIYEGRTVTEWVVLLDGHANHRQQNEEARRAFLKLGPRAVPDLERLLAARPSSRSEWLRGWGVRLKILRPRPMQLYELQRNAARAAQIVGDDTRADIRSLIPDLTDRFTNGYAFHGVAEPALAAAGPEGISVLTNLLFIGEPAVRDSAGWGLGNWAPKSPMTVEALVRAAWTETNLGVRADLIGYLRNTTVGAEKAVPIANEALQSTNTYTRERAVMLLARFPTNAEAHRSLERAANDSDESVRSTAQRALANPRR